MGYRYRNMRIGCLIAGLFPAIPAIAAASTATPGIPDIQPPPLIECRTEATCDRNPRHLEAFVAGFYKWYLAEEHAFDDLVADKSPAAEHKKHGLASAHYEDHIMRHWLTPDYYHWSTIFTTQPPPPSDPRYCGGSMIFCIDAWSDEKILNAPVKLISIDKKTAKLTLTFPGMPEYNESPYQLTVALKVVKGQWRIDGVTIQDL